MGGGVLPRVWGKTPFCKGLKKLHLRAKLSLRVPYIGLKFSKGHTYYVIVPSLGITFCSIRCQKPPCLMRASLTYFPYNYESSWNRAGT